MNGEKSPDNGSAEKKQWTVNEAIAEIGVLRQRALQSGSVDSENDEYTRLIIELRNGEIEPNDAVEEAHKIDAGRQDYH